MLSVAIENVRFKYGYTRYLRNSFYAAIVIHFLVFYFSPEFKFEPYVLSKMEPFKTVEIADDYILPKKLKDIEQPLVPMPTDDLTQVQNAAIVTPTSFVDIKDLLAVSPVSSEKLEKFYPFDEKPVLIQSVAPRYPELSRQAGIEGTVDLKVIIDKYGEVISVRVINSEVTDTMIKAATTAVKQFRFKPARQRNRPVKAAILIPIRFRLH